MHGGAKMLVTGPAHMHPLEFPALVEYGARAGQGLNGLCPFKPVPVGTEPGMETSPQPDGHAGQAHPEVSIRARQKKPVEMLLQRLRLRDQGAAFARRRLQGALLQNPQDPRGLVGRAGVSVLPQLHDQIADGQLMGGGLAWLPIMR